MIEMHGKLVFSTLEEIVDPAHTAVLVIDMQNDFGHPDGVWPRRLGVDISMIAEATPRIADFLRAARSTGALIIHTQHTQLPHMRSDSAARMRIRLPGSRFSWPADFEQTLEGSWGQQFLPELQPLPGEIVIKKYRASSFFGTNLGVVLRANAIKSLVITGCLTNGCVMATALHAGWLDYYTTVVSDCVATWEFDQHQPALAMLSTQPAATVISAWGVQATVPQVPAI